MVEAATAAAFALDCMLAAVLSSRERLGLAIRAAFLRTSGPATAIAADVVPAAVAGLLAWLKLLDVAKLPL